MSNYLFATYTMKSALIQCERNVGDFPQDSVIILPRVRFLGIALASAVDGLARSLFTLFLSVPYFLSRPLSSWKFARCLETRFTQMKQGAAAGLTASAIATRSVYEPQYAYRCRENLHKKLKLSDRVNDQKRTLIQGAREMVKAHKERLLIKHSLFVGKSAGFTTPPPGCFILKNNYYRPQDLLKHGEGYFFDKAAEDLINALEIQLDELIFEDDIYEGVPRYLQFCEQIEAVNESVIQAIGTLPMTTLDSVNWQFVHLKGSQDLLEERISHLFERALFIEKSKNANFNEEAFKVSTEKYKSEIINAFSSKIVDLRSRVTVIQEEYLKISRKSPEEDPGGLITKRYVESIQRRPYRNFRQLFLEVNDWVERKLLFEIEEKMLNLQKAPTHQGAKSWWPFNNLFSFAAG